MSPTAPRPSPLPGVLFVMGKGGVGRSTVCAALGLHFAARGERVLLVEWALSEAIAPWFGQPAAGLGAVAIADRLSVCNFSLADSLREYFVNHLGMRTLHDVLISGRAVRRLLDAVPGLHELMFLGRLFGLSTVAPAAAAADEDLPRFDRFIVDAPATGYGASLFAVPSTFASLGAGGLLRFEVARVEEMLGDPARTGAFVVTLPEELPVSETVELVPRLTRELGRPPLALLVNRSLATISDEGGAGAGTPQLRPAWLDPLTARIADAQARAGLEALWAEVRRRDQHEHELQRRLQATCPLGIWRLDDQLLDAEPADAAEVARRLSVTIGAQLDTAIDGRAATTTGAPAATGAP